MGSKIQDDQIIFIRYMVKYLMGKLESKKLLGSSWEEISTKDSIYEGR